MTLHVMLISPRPTPPPLLSALPNTRVSAYTPATYTESQPPDIAILAELDTERMAHIVQVMRAAWPLCIIIGAVPPEAQAEALKTNLDDLLGWPLQAAEVRHRLALWQRHRLQPLGEYGDFDILGHDLRSPLGTIIASLGLLREELAAYPDAPISLISDLARAAHRQNALIENMVDYMRLSSGQYAYERAPVYLDALLDEFLSQSEESVQRKGVAFVVDAPPITRPVVGQADLLRRATLAVLDNSLKFCTRQSQMQVVLRATNNAARLTIRDTGRPILADYAHYLFQPLGQFSARAAGSRSSVALNLPFAASVMALIGGDLSAEMQDEWAVFTFEMPWHAAG